MSDRAPASESRVNGFLERLKEHPKRWGDFLREVRVEMRQVTWPSRHEVIITTGIVIIAVAFFGAFFFGVDSTVSYLVNQLFTLFRH